MFRLLHWLMIPASVLIIWHVALVDMHYDYNCITFFTFVLIDVGVWAALSILWGAGEVVKSFCSTAAKLQQIGTFSAP